MKGSYLDVLKKCMMVLLVVFIGFYGYTWIRLYKENLDKRKGIDHVLRTTVDTFMYILWVFGAFIYYNFIASSDENKWDWHLFSR